MNKGIWAGLVAIAFVAGTVMTGTMAYAASNAQGQPFQQLQQQLNALQSTVDSFFDIFVDLQETDEDLQRQIDNLGSSGNDFTVDSFFDVFYEIELNSSSCPEGQVPQVDRDLQATTCVPETALTPDSFFDVFYEIQLDTQQNTEDIGEIQTELVALELRSLPPVCTSGDVVKYNGLTGLWECAVDQTGAGVETDPQVGTLVTGQWCRSDGTKIDCDVTPVDSSNFARLDAVNTFGALQQFQEINVMEDAIFRTNVEVLGDTRLGDTLTVDGLSQFRSNVDVFGTMTAPTVRGTDQVCIGSDCRNVWPSGGSSGRLQVIAREDPTPATFVGPVTDSFAPCLSGEIVVGGGYRLGSADTNVFAEFSAFTAEGFGWLVSARNPAGVGTVTAIAYCATIVP